MNVNQRLDAVAESYRNQGYQVVVNPGPDVLPPFASDFQLELLATREEGGVLVSAKASPKDLEADPLVAHYAEVIGQQPGWRFDLFVLGPDAPVLPGNRDAIELSEEEIRQMLADVERMLHAGFVRQSLVLGWAALAAAMRQRLHAEGETNLWGTSPRSLLDELYSVGAISTGVLRKLEALFNVQNAVAQGYSTPVAVDANAVRFLLDTASQLLTESQKEKQLA